VLRNTYSNVIKAVVRTTPGNVLVMMPSYQESSWATDVLVNDPNITKNVLTDTSSSDTATEQIKQAFFEGPPKVLTTSLRGTLSEGVDFNGDKLRGTVVCGVPLVNTSTNFAAAIESAYDHRFNGKGFEYALSIPAVRKARQALGRVIRGNEDVGVRVLVDERYVRNSSGGVKKYFPDNEIDEFVSIAPDDLAYELETFWSQ
jgi:DNA excision repair protein ERCC-2